jgi:Fic family protein
MVNLQRVGFETRQELFLASLSAEVLESSLIENEVFSAPAVRSSIARKLGIPASVDAGRLEKKAEGIIQILLEATQNFRDPLTEERLLRWHRQLMAQDHRILAGEYRTDPIYVGSGAIGPETVHFEGPPPERVVFEMKRFYQWLAAPDTPSASPLVQSSLAHLWFVTIHPFEDGNGRMARAIAESFLARADQSSERYRSVSASLNARRKEYYEALESAQKGTPDITEWLVWSLGALEQGIERSLSQVQRTIATSAIWRRALEAGMNPRQRKMLPRLLEGFEGPLTTAQWASICHCSQDSATRDIAAWLSLRILERSESGGRSTHYRLVMPADPNERG